MLQKKMKKVISLSRSGASAVPKRIANVVGETLKKLFLAAGAEFNPADETFSLNGVDGITEEQMLLIYERRAVLSECNMHSVAAGECARTLFPAHGVVGRRRVAAPADLSEAFSNSSLEVIKFGDAQSLDGADSDNLLPVSAIDATFTACGSLHTIYPMDVSRVKAVHGDTFGGCTALRELRLKGLSADIDISSSPLLSYQSVNYIVCYAASSGITLKVHPDTYAYVTGQRQAPEWVGGSVSAWEVLSRIAELKGVCFVSGANEDKEENEETGSGSSAISGALVEGDVLLLPQASVEGSVVDLSGAEALVEDEVLAVA